MGCGFLCVWGFESCGGLVGFLACPHWVSMDKAPSLLCLEWEYFRSLLQRTRLCFWQQQKVLHSFSVKKTAFSASWFYTRCYFLVSSNAANCVSESISRVPMPKHGVLHCVSHLAFTFCVQLGSLRNTSVQTKKNTASSPFDLVSELFVVPTTSHGLETTLRSVSKTQTRFTEKMCQVPEEGWSWLLP